MKNTLNMEATKIMTIMKSIMDILLGVIWSTVEAMIEVSTAVLLARKTSQYIT